MPNSLAASKIQTILQDTTDLVRYGKRVAEWEFDVPSAVVLTERAWPLSQAVVAIAQFRAAFPWLPPEQVDIALADQDQHAIWCPTEIPLDQWLAHLTTPDARCAGIEATLALTGAAVTTTGDLVPITLHDAACLEIRAIPAPKSIVNHIFTIWPNVFTDTIDVLDTDGGRSYPFAAAARQNRQQLTASLRQWEQRTSGNITNWVSERLEHGIERYGIAADAEPY